MKVMTEEELADAKIDTSTISANLDKPTGSKSPLLAPAAQMQAKE